MKKLTQGDNQYFFKMFRFMKPYAFRYGISQILYSGQGFVLPFILSAFITNIMYAIVIQSRDEVMSAGITLAISIGVFLVVLLVSVAINLVVQERAIMDLRKQLFRAFMRTGIEDATHSGEGIASINNDVETASKVFSGPLMQFLYSVIAIFGFTISIFVIQWRLGIALIIVGIISFFMQSRFTKPLAEVGKERLEANADALKATSNIFNGARTIRAYNIQKQAFLTFDKESQRLKLLDMRRGIISIGQGLFTTIEGWLTLGIVFGFGGWLAATERMEFHTLAGIYVMASSLTSAIGSIGTNYANLQPPLVGAKRVFAIIEADEARKNSKVGGVTRTPKGHTLDIKGLNFRYVDAEKDTLSNINLNIPENKMVAIIGESGSGKSTLLRSIMGMYEREDMNITVGDLSFNESSLNGWRNNFAYVDQSCKLFDMTIKENIAMGFGGSAGDDLITDAARRAKADEFINQQENGYDTPCGENGDAFSGGQKQRIAIARALVRKAPILLFDEATSALDKDSERHIMDTIESLRSNHTILYTTHNMDNVKTADTIVVMDAGEIAETGTHDELIAKKGLYCSLILHGIKS